LEQIAEFLRRHAQETHNSVTEVTKGMEDGHHRLRERLSELKSNYQDAERNLASLSETLVAQTKTVEKVSDDAISKVNGWDRVVKQRISEFGKAAESVSKQSEATTKSLAKQTAVMQQATSDAKEVMVEIKAQTEALSVEDFLRGATFVLEKLQSLAVDMNRLLETNVSEEDWQRFNRGEKGVFVRKMLGFREKARLASIRERYQDDSEFRDYVSRYMTQFESLLQNAKKRDHQGVLGTTFLASDIGKVYMLLGQALGREH
jgi:chromosome segregation ATPase